MAAVTELSFLLFAVINYIHAQEPIIILRKEGSSSYSFNLPENTDSCLISRSVGEEKLVLWNTSDLWSNKPSLPEDLKRRLFSDVKTSSYTIRYLTHSDSGRYREECWTDGNVTHDNNFTITVCTAYGGRDITVRELGVTVDLPCWPGKLDVQWLKRDSRYKQETDKDHGPWNRVFGDKTTSVKDDVTGRYQVVTNTSTLRVSNITATDVTWYMCLVMNQQQCVSSYAVELELQTEMIYHSVGESTVLPCTIADSTDEQPPRWSKWSTDLGQLNQNNPSVDQNYSLVFSSLMLNHSGQYDCKTSRRQQHYYLYVCPKSGPPAVELFSEGEEVTLRCRDWAVGKRHVWFIKSNRTEGRIFSVKYQSMSRVSWYYNNGILVISNISVGDAGEYWCVFVNEYSQCVSTESYTVVLELQSEVIYRSVGDSAVLPCTITESTDKQPPRWTKGFTDLEQLNQTDPSVDQNYSLVFSSLMLNHSGQYDCKTSRREQHYELLVCPKFGPPAVELFSEGEEVTLRCRDWGEDKWNMGWFIKSQRTQGRIFRVTYYQSMSRVSRYYNNGSLVISNISVGDAGEYWCVAIDDDDQCVSTERSVLVYMEPFGIYSTFFKVRCSGLSVLLLMLCAAVVAVNLRTRRGAQL